jgi:glycosyltransferase involved in cell wall biosynthesis
MPGKGVEHLVEAASMLFKMGFEADFLLVGEGPLKVTMQRMARSAGLTKVKFVDFIPPALVPKLIRECLMFVLPSIREGFPRTLVEAMASGKAVVAANTPTIREGLAGCGVLVKPRDAKSLADAIMNLAGQSAARKALGQKARAAALTRYDWRHVLSKLSSLYQETLTNPRWGR